jgi:O-antigen ligase
VLSLNPDLKISFQKKMEKFFNFFILLACFSVSMPTAWMSFSTAMIIIFWLLTGNFKEKFKHINHNPVAISVLGLLFIYFFAMFYSTAEWSMRGIFFLKYFKLILIPILISTINSDALRKKALNAFLYGTFLLLFISYFKWLKIFPMDLGLHDIHDPLQGFTAFKNRIAHNIIMSFSMYLLLYRFSLEKTKTKWIYLALALLMLFDIIFLVNGRTGQLIAISLAVFFMFHRWGFKAFVYPVLISLLLLPFKEELRGIRPDRLLGTYSEIQNFSDNNQTSAGLRLEMYKNTLLLAFKSPWVGYGTGALKDEYRKAFEHTNIIVVDVPNPHNQYILTFFEVGLVGLLAFLNLFYQSYKIAFQFLKKEPMVAYSIFGLLITFMMGSLFNSLLLDASEGKFFCLLLGIMLSSYKSKKSCSFFYSRIN